jgi:ElaB/YqjD/DUF883 family membrane-anchored ribosome-binding protein
MDEMPPALGRSRSTNDALQKLIEDVKVLSADTRDLLQHTADQSGERLARVRDRMRETLSSVEARVQPFQRALTERAQHVSRVSTQHVRHHPVSTLAAAAAVVLAVVALCAWQAENSGGQDEQ